MIWDLLIIGGGPAAIQAAIMASSEGLKTLVIERDKVGGQIGQTPLLENFIASQGGITGPQFAEAMKAQAERMGASFVKGNVIGFDRNFHSPKGQFTVSCDTPDDVDKYEHHVGQTIVIATGNRWQDLDIPGIREGIENRTVHYGPVECLNIDPAGSDVAVYGGGPSAGQAIIALAGKARTVHVLMRSTLRMPQYLVDTINALPNVKLYNHTTIKKVVSNGSEISIHLGDSGIVVEHLFMCSGLVPNTEWLSEEIQKDETGRVRVGASVDAKSFLGTSMAGVFAIGDCREGSTARVSAAIGDGAFVVTEVWKYFRENPVCSVCKPADFSRAASEYNPYKKGQWVSYAKANGPFRVLEVLNAQQVQLAGVAGIVEVNELTPSPEPATV